MLMAARASVVDEDVNDVPVLLAVVQHRVD
jgi:hypothetical protein